MQIQFSSVSTLQIVLWAQQTLENRMETSKKKGLALFRFLQLLL